jgi:hypothetical protein
LELGETVDDTTATMSSVAHSQSAVPSDATLVPKNASSLDVRGVPGERDAVAEYYLYLAFCVLTTILEYAYRSRLQSYLFGPSGEHALVGLVGKNHWTVVQGPKVFVLLYSAYLVIPAADLFFEAGALRRPSLGGPGGPGGPVISLTSSRVYLPWVSQHACVWAGFLFAGYLLIKAHQALKSSERATRPLAAPRVFTSENSAAAAPRNGNHVVTMTTVRVLIRALRV